MKRFALAALVVAACGNDHAMTTTTPDAAVDPDPLDITDTPVPRSLDDLQERIISKNCSGQPGLCHNGQFEPNLSTAAMTYAYVVDRPSIEKTTQLRVKPGEATTSVLIDKLRNRNVSTQMPLGAPPLAESDIEDIEAWIDAGALRAPGAPAVQTLDNPPKRPEIAIYNASGTRIDGTGPIHVAIGTQLTIRHSVQDFETPDASIPFAGMILIDSAAGGNVALNPAANDPSLGQTTYDATGPMGVTDQLDFQRPWTVPTTLSIYNGTTATTTNVAASGQSLALLVVYIDQTTGGIAVFDTCPSTIVIQ